MKDLFQFIVPTAKSAIWLLAKYTAIVITIYIAVDAWVIGKANTVVEPVKSEMIIMHREAMSGIDKRFEDSHKYQTERFDRLEILIMERK